MKGNLELETTRHMLKNCDATKSAEYGTFPCHITLPNTRVFFATLWETVYGGMYLKIYQNICLKMVKKGQLWAIALTKKK